MGANCSAYHLVFDAVCRGRDLTESDLWYSRCNRVGRGTRSKGSTACGEGAAEEEVLGRAGSRGGMAGGHRAEEAGRRASEETGGQHRRVVATDAAALLSSQNVNRISLKEIVFASSLESSSSQHCSYPVSQYYNDPAQPVRVSYRSAIITIHLYRTR